MTSRFPHFPALNKVDILASFSVYNYGGDRQMNEFSQRLENENNRVPCIFHEAHPYCCKTRLFENAIKSVAMLDNLAPNNKKNIARWLKDMSFIFSWH